jgi:hypothetical protein
MSPQFDHLHCFTPFTLNPGGPKVNPASDYRGRGTAYSRGTVIQDFVL